MTRAPLTLAIVLALSSAGARELVSNTAPALPREKVVTATVPPVVRRVPVPAGGSLQQALDTARRGDWIELQSGATYTGSFRLRRIDGDGWIVITSRPGEGCRIRARASARCTSRSWRSCAHRRARC
jgi:hypothetical protein